MFSVVSHSMFGLDYIVKNMVTCTHLTDPEARWLMLSLQGWALEGTRTLMTLSTGQQERQVLNSVTLATGHTVATTDVIIHLDAFSLCCCRF